jgi:hypothetical protein
MGEKRNALSILVEKLEGKGPLGRQRCRQEDNIKMDLQRNRVGCCGLDSCLMTGFSGGLL